MKLKKVIKDIEVRFLKGSKEKEITGISLDSRVIAPGHLFIALRGEKYDGNEFINQAILAGAVAVVTDIFNPFLDDIVQIVVKDVASVVPILAHNFYQDPSSKLCMIGITGTNGKTTTSYIIKHLLESKGPVGLIGTIERIIGDYRTPADLTTPDCITLHKLLHEMIVSHLRYACMEVSSHALDQKRVAGLKYDRALFTNLSEEHLDYHKNMESYLTAKAALFSPLYMKEGGIAVVNIDSPFAGDIIRHIAGKVVTFGFDKEADYRVSDITYRLDKTLFTVTHQDETMDFTLPLIGEYNVYNALGAIAIAHLENIPFETLSARLAHFPPVRGRLQKVKNKHGFHIFVDFAHTAAALANVLQTLRKLKAKKIITLFGCGGNRDREKRPKMAEVAETYSDWVIVTSDNPRNEDPEEIIGEIVKGFTLNKYQVYPNRKEAMQAAIGLLTEGDILLIAGRGHELRQIQKLQCIDFDDVKVAEEIVNVLI